MTTIDEFRKVASRVSNWGRWGDQDQLGTLNLIDEAKIAESASMVRQGRVISLGAAFDAQGPQGRMAPFRTNPIHLMTIDGGDGPTYAEQVRGWGNACAEMIGSVFDIGPMRFNDDYIMMPLQAATQWDALSHVYYDDLLYNGFPASSVTSQGATRCSIDQVSRGVVSRGVLLDVARHRGAATADPDDPITPSELDAVADAHGIEIRGGDVVVVRTGWYGAFNRSPRNYEAHSAGLHWSCAEWLHTHDVAAVAADNPAVEHGGMHVDTVFLPMHCLCLRDMGLMFGEIWDLEALGEDCASDGVYEFQLVAPPLRVTGAVGTPLNPLALK
ncbi:MAG: cyclase family protein [Acidimicrobiales bacterium]|nr:cyclase family protein [Acidimicrobiales bacterium]